LDRIKQILAMQIGILPGSHLSFLPDEAGLTLHGLPYPLDELGLAIVRDKAESMHTETVHVTERPHDAIAGHGPEERVQRAGLLAEEVPGGVMRSGSLRYLAVRVGLDGVDQVGEFYSVLDEEDGDVVADDVCATQNTFWSAPWILYTFPCLNDEHTEIALIGIEPRGEPMDITSCICTTAAPSHGGEADKDGRFLIFTTEERCGGNIREVSIGLEDSMSPCEESSSQLRETNMQEGN
jgi:hypothetical protein